MTRFTPQWLQQGNYAASVDRRLLSAIWPTAASAGCAVTAGSGMTVNVAAGQVAIPTANNTGSVLCTSDTVEQVALAAAPAAGTNRYDLVTCQARGNDLDGGASDDFIFANVTGTAAASPIPPAVPNNAVALAQIYVAGGSASVIAGNISDLRPGGLSFGPRGVLSYSIRTVDFAVTTTETTVLSATVTVAANRRIRLEFSFRNVNGAANAVAFVRLSSTGVAQLAEYQLPVMPSLAGMGGTYAVVTAPAAGPRTFTASVFVNTGTGTMQATSVAPITFVVTDIGPV